jgi:hypothetical protein
MYFIVNYYQNKQTVLINAENEDHAHFLFESVYKTNDYTLNKVNVTITYTPEGRAVVNYTDENEKD